MANAIRIRRRSSAGAAGAPSSLANAELAFNEQSNVLYYGTGTGGANGTATQVIAIGGDGYFMSIGGTQTVTGSKTFSAAVSGVTALSSDNSTSFATTAYVKSQSYLTANQSITVSGDATGSGTTSVAVTISSGAVTNAKMANVSTATIKGRVTSGTGSPEDLTASQAKTILAIVPGDVTGFDTQVRTSSPTQLALATANFDVNNNRILNVSTPTGSGDAANKAYVDNVSQGLDVKASVRAATTTNVTLSGTTAMDGVSIVAGDRVLVKDQTTGSENGIYVVAAGSWSRASDSDTSVEVTAGMFTFVSEGTLNADSGWVLATNDAITLGTTALAFTQFSGAGQVVSGDGLTKTGNTLNVVGTAGQIAVVADSVGLATYGAGVATYKSVLVDIYGRVTSGTSPTTLSGYGITDAQPVEATLTGIAATAPAANQLIYSTGNDVFATTSFTSTGRNLAGAADVAAAITVLGLDTIDGGTF